MTVLDTENPKDFTKAHKKTLSELRNKFSKITGYKINIQISVVFPDTLTMMNKLLQVIGRGKINNSYNSVKKNKLPKNELNQGG